MVRMKHWNKVDDDDEVFDPRYYPKLVYKDGYGPHVSLMLTDAMQRDQAPVLHRPGSLALSDAQIQDRERSREEWSAFKRNLWRQQGAPSAVRDGAKITAGPLPLDPRDQRDPREVAYDERSRRNRDAWRNPGAVR
jgi:hypothetical protein